MNAAAAKMLVILGPPPYHHAQGRTLPSIASRTHASSTLSPTRSRWPWLADAATAVEEAEVAREGLRLRHTSVLSLASRGPPGALWSCWSIAGIGKLFVSFAALPSVCQSLQRIKQLAYQASYTSKVGGEQLRATYGNSTEAQRHR